MRGRFVLLLLTLIHFTAKSSDTLFTRSVEVPGRVQNIDCDGSRLLIRLSDRLFMLEHDSLTELSLPVKRRFSWFSHSDASGSIFHTDLPIDGKIVQTGELDYILPGFFTNTITKGRIGNKLFVSYRGNLLEYKIETDINLYLKGTSVRHIFLNDTIRIISTYNGIYLDRNYNNYGEKILSGSNYSNGELNAIGNELYLCQDGLFLLNGDSAFSRLRFEINGAPFRKLLDWNGRTVALLDKRISYFDLESLNETHTLLDHETIYDAEVWEEDLVCCSSNGVVTRFRNGQKADSVQLEGVLNDISVEGKNILVSSDSGIYSLDRNLTPTLLLDDLQCLQARIADDCIFITSLNGLYMLKDGNLFTLVSDVEFNRRALTIFNNYLYAGSIDGIYSIKLSDFFNHVLSHLEPVPIKIEKTKALSMNYPLAIFAIIIGGLLLWFLFRKRVKNELIHESKNDFNPELISKLIREDPSILSIQNLAGKLNTSVVQLNRKLKIHGTTPLTVMQQVKKEIAIEMFSKGESLEHISKRTGYSKRYIREKFLNQDELKSSTE